MISALILRTGMRSVGVESFGSFKALSCTATFPGGGRRLDTPLALTISFHFSLFFSFFRLRRVFAFRSWPGIRHPQPSHLPHLPPNRHHTFFVIESADASRSCVLRLFRIFTTSGSRVADSARGIGHAFEGREYGVRISQAWRTSDIM